MNTTMMLNQSLESSLETEDASWMSGMTSSSCNTHARGIESGGKIRGNPGKIEKIHNVKGAVKADLVVHPIDPPRVHKHEPLALEGAWTFLHQVQHPAESLPTVDRVDHNPSRSRHLQYRSELILGAVCGLGFRAQG